MRAAEGPLMLLWGGRGVYYPLARRVLPITFTHRLVTEALPVSDAVWGFVLDLSGSSVGPCCCWRVGSWCFAIAFGRCNGEWSKFSPADGDTPMTSRWNFLSLLPSPAIPAGFLLPTLGNFSRSQASCLSRGSSPFLAFFWIFRRCSRRRANFPATGGDQLRPAFGGHGP